MSAHDTGPPKEAAAPEGTATQKRPQPTNYRHGSTCTGRWTSTRLRAAGDTAVGPYEAAVRVVIAAKNGQDRAADLLNDAWHVGRPHFREVVLTIVNMASDYATPAELCDELAAALAIGGDDE